MSISPGSNVSPGKSMCLTPGGHLQRAVRADLRDLAVVPDQDRGLLDIAPGRHVEHPVGGDDRCGGGRCGGEEGGRAGEQIFDH